MRNITYLLAILFLIVSCSKNNDTNTNPDTTPEQTDVYVAGCNNGKIVYWKNGVETTLATTELGFGMAYDIVVAGTDVYVAGYNKNSKAVYWKNGLEIPLYTAPDGFSDARAIAVDGNDVYITGREAFSSTGQNAFVWKNGVKTILTPVNSGTKREGTGITVAGGDVYVSGNSGGAAVYWKNGVVHVLADQLAEATGIAVSGTDVYVSGREGTQAVYWKNGVKTVLTSLTAGVAKGILVSGSDVYLVGTSSDQAVVWKNNVQTTLDPSYSATANAIASKGKDIFIAGKIATSSTTTCVTWQNEIKKELATVTNDDPLKSATATAMVAVTH